MYLFNNKRILQSTISDNIATQGKKTKHGSIKLYSEICPSLQVSLFPVLVRKIYVDDNIMERENYLGSSLFSFI